MEDAEELAYDLSGGVGVWREGGEGDGGDYGEEGFCAEPDDQREE